MTLSEPEPKTLENVVEEYLQQLRGGHHPSISAYQQEHPHLASEIGELLPLVVAIEGWKKEETSAHGGTNTLGGVPLAQLGDFRIVREIGRGGMGIVYEAIQLSLNRPVAIKVLPPLGKSISQGIDRFRREAQLAAQLHHPHIVPVFGIGHDNGFHYIVMQRIHGCALDDVLYRHQKKDSTAKAANSDPLTSPANHTSSAGSPLPPKLVARLGIEAAEALAYAHQAGVLHRDIKPANLLLDQQGQLWIADFGLARILEEPSLSRSGEITGTLAYLAPERLHGDGDARADIYSLGLTLAEMVRGKPVFGDLQNLPMVQQITRGIPRRRGALGDTIPLDLETSLLKAIDVDPSHRYQLASDFADDLRAFLDDRPIAARPPSPWESMQRWCRRNPLLAAMTTTIAALLLLTTTVTSLGLLEQQKMRLRTEATLNTALAALDSIYERHAGADDLLRGPAQGTVVISDETAEMLDQLLEVYDELASQAGDSAKLERDSLLAMLRVAEIQFKLGNYSAAAEQYQQSLVKIPELRSTLSSAEDHPWSIRQIIAQLGWAAAIEAMSQTEAADQLRLETLQQLEDLSGQWNSSEMESWTIYTHYLLGRQRTLMLAVPEAARPMERVDRRRPFNPRDDLWRPRGPRGPAGRELPARRPFRPHHLSALVIPPATEESRDSVIRRTSHLERAVKLTSTQFPDLAPYPGLRLLRGMILMELARLPDQSSDVTATRIEASLGFIESLCMDFPTISEYQFEHARNLWIAAQLRLQGGRDLPPAAAEASLLAAENWLMKSVQITRRLHEYQPQIREYSFLLARVCEAHAVVSQELGILIGDGPPEPRIRLADGLIEEAIELQRALVDRAPQGKVEPLWLARYRITALTMQLGRPNRDRLLAQLDEIRALLGGLESEPATAEVVARLQQELAAVEAEANRPRPARRDPPPFSPPAPIVQP